MVRRYRFGVRKGMTIAHARKRVQRRRMARGGQFYGKTVKQPVQYFTRTAFFPAIFTATTSAPAPAVSVFRLSDVPNPTDFTTLYDQYQIKAIKYTIIPKFTNSTLQVGSGAAATLLGNVWSVIDYDDAATPAALTDLLQYQNLKRTRMDRTHSRYLVPKVNTTVGANIQPKAKVWLDVGTTNTPHHGIKLWFDSIVGISNTEIKYDLMVKYYLAFKNVR